MIPSIDTYAKQRSTMLKNLESYFTNGTIGNDLADQIVSKVEDFVTPFATY